MFKVGDKCHKLNRKSNMVEMQWKGSKFPKIYTVIYVNEGIVKVCNNDEVLFDLGGDVLKAPPLIGSNSSNWYDHKLVKVKIEE